MAQLTGNARNILVGASPLFISNIDSTTSGYATYENSEPGTANAAAFVTGTSYTDTLNAVSSGTFYYRNVGYTNNGLQITYNPTYDSVTVDQLLDTAKLFKSAMEVMIMTERYRNIIQEYPWYCSRCSWYCTNRASAYCSWSSTNHTEFRNKQCFAKRSTCRACILCTSCSICTAITVYPSS